MWKMWKILGALDEASLISRRLRHAIQVKLNIPKRDARSMDDLIMSSGFYARLGFDLSAQTPVIQEGIQEWVDEGQSSTALAAKVRTLKTVNLRNQHLEQQLQEQLDRLARNLETTDIETVFQLYQGMKEGEDSYVDPEFMKAVESEGWFEAAKRIRAHCTLGSPWDEQQRPLDNPDGSNDEDLQTIAQYPYVALWYAEEIMEGNTEIVPDFLRNAIARDPKTAAKYAYWLRQDHRRWKPGGRTEQLIAEDAEASVEYANIYGKRFRLGEAAINADPKWLKVYEDKIADGKIDGDKYTQEA